VPGIEVADGSRASIKSDNKNAHVANGKAKASNWTSTIYESDDVSITVCIVVFLSYKCNCNYYGFNFVLVKIVCNMHLYWTTSYIAFIDRNPSLLLMHIHHKCGSLLRD